MIADLAKIINEPPTEPNWLVPDFLHKGQIVCIAGAEGVGKSMLGYYLAICLANQTAFYNQRMISGKTLYLDEENSIPDSEQYVRWIWHGLKKPQGNLVINNFFLENFSLAAQGNNRWRYMEARAKEKQPDLIIIDTATSACGIQNENDNGEATAAMLRLRQVRAIAGENTSMIIFKHILHNQEGIRTIRGAKAWLGMADAVLYHHAKPGRPPLNGFRTTFVSPGKVRAFGLKEELKIIPGLPPKIASGDLLHSVTFSISLAENNV